VKQSPTVMLSKCDTAPLLTLFEQYG